MQKNRIALAFAIAFPIALPVVAQTVDAANTPPNLPQVTVSASRSQARVESMPLNTTIVSQEDIQKSSAQTLDQLLRDVPGLNFTGVPAAQSDPTGHQTKMRGMGNAKVLVLLDGIPIHDPFYLTTQWFKVPLSNVERVEVVRGGNSSLWGNMAVAGVVNIVSKRAANNAGEASVSVGTSGTSNVSISKNFALSDALSFNITVDQMNSRGYKTVLADQQWRFPSREPVDATNSNLQLTAFFKPSSDISGYLRVGHHIQDQDISYQYGNNLQTNPDLSASVANKFDDNSTLTVAGWAQNVAFEKYNGASCYWQPSGTRCPSTTNVTQAQVNNQIVQYYTQYGSQRYRERGASAIYSRDTAGLLQSLQVGADYRHLWASDIETFFSAPTSLTALQNLSSGTFGTANQTFTGLFAQARLVPVEALSVTLSARYDNWENTDRVNTRTTAAGATSGGAQPATSTSAVNPSIAARYAVNDNVALRAAAYKSFRAPGFNNTTRTFGSPNPTIANPDLNPENLFGREIGVDFNKGNVILGATYFQYDIKDMIATYSLSSTSPLPALVQTICGTALASCAGRANFYTNDQDGQSSGLEFAARWQVKKDLTLSATYTRTETKLTRKGFVGGEPVGVQTAGVPQDVASLGVTWRATGNLQTYVQARYIGSMNIDTTSTPGTEYKQGANTVLDASVVYKLNKSMDFTASVVNLLDTEYSENAYTYNQPWSRTLSMPRTASIGVKVRF